MSCACSGVYVDVPQFLACAARYRDKMRGVFLAQNRQRFFGLAQLYGALSCKVPTLCIAFCQAAAGEERLGSTVVSGTEMYLRKIERVLVIPLR